MPSSPSRALRDHFADLPDPRIDRTKRHQLLDIVTIAICAIICNADSWVDIERFGNAKLPWLRTFLSLPNGIPSHDTFGRVFAALDPAALERGFVGWVQALVGEAAPGTIAIDGKTVRRSHDQISGKGPVHLVSAWASEAGLVLGQVATADKSNEITAIPALLETLRLEGALVTIDAMGCQSAIASQIVAGGGDYVLALKENQPALHELVADHFALDAGLHNRQGRTVEKNHGRLEVRTCQVTDDPAILAWLDPDRSWPGLRSIAAVTGERRIGATSTTETRYYLSSLAAEPVQIGEAVRRHWGIENQVHWVLDMVFREDASRVRTGYAAENLAVLRKIAVNLLRQETTNTASLKGKRLICGWDEAYLTTVLTPILL